MSWAIDLIARTECTKIPCGQRVVKNSYKNGTHSSGY